ncbi:hypothetical protein Lepto7376_0640 [[Leptolyngbya] sp. PCC 7376]|uniref:YgaP family membrane protein n=1 Tax=[Leptolyngbya] sp. PCC 7376 TaxID=111781 RepID=UPI00029F4C7E|nr:DUF2892 domain-containing protein [[Leptolyngbya] sp. PCC 7376]AFY37051.1 hypothetical protein Lepto7376_0640 [[Leptolyngbya] sp. PCC 7376]
MFNNLGMGDHLIRIFLASVFGFLGLSIYGGSTVGVVLDFAAGILAFSALVGSCMLYGLFGINTRSQ